MSKNSVLKLLASIAIAQVAGLIGSIFTVRSVMTWYPTLRKPPFTPPSSVFGPVWIVLFTLMGIALFLIWNKGLDREGVKPAIKMFGIQLALNTLWSIVFFGLKSPLYGLIDIAFLWAAILATIVLFVPISVPAALLLIPYFLWTSFAAILNYSIWRLNR